jgi:hypothetical protein
LLETVNGHGLIELLLGVDQVENEAQQRPLLMQRMKLREGHY